MLTYSFSQNGHPLYIATNGENLEEQSMRVRATNEYVYLDYIRCETTKGGTVFNGSQELNKTAVYGGYCEYTINSAPLNDLTSVTLLCSVKTGEAVLYLGADGFSGLSQHIDSSPLKATPAACPVVGDGWRGFSAVVADGSEARMPLTTLGASVLTAGWINGKFTFIVVDTGASQASLNLAVFSIPITGKGKYILANGTSYESSLGDATICYVGVLCTTMEVSDTPKTAAPLLGLSFFRQFNKVTINLEDQTLDLQSKKEKP
jgi:hypothetical protein